MLKIHGVSHKGLVRNNNEDHFLVGDQIFTDKEYSTTLDTDKGYFLAVADGMGGHRAGEIASSKVLQELLMFSANIMAPIGFKDFEEVMNSWVKKIHQQLIDEGNKSPEWQGMGTTLTGIYVLKNNAYLFNVGDSRTYIAHNGSFAQLTKDHSKTQFYGPGSRMVNFLTNCLGAGNKVFVDLLDISHYLQTGNKLLICSDGVTDMLSDGKISELFPIDQSDILLSEAIKAGGRDNITYIRVEFL